MKAFIYLSIALVAALFILSANTLTVASDNVSANVTTINGTLTVTYTPDVSTLLEDMNTTLEKGGDTFSGLAEKIFEAFLLLGMLSLTLWKRELFLYVVTGLLTLTISLTWFNDYPLVSLCLIGLACFLLFEAVRLAFFKKSRNEGTKGEE